MKGQGEVRVKMEVEAIKASIQPDARVVELHRSQLYAWRNKGEWVTE